MFEIDRRARASIQQQLYDLHRSAIVEGRLSAGERLASARSLAVQLNVARGTVDLAYARLAADGFVAARGQRGTFVISGVDRRSLANARAGVPDRLEPLPADEYELPFRLGVPALDLFPRKLWSRLAARQARKVDPAGLRFPDPVGLPALREAIVAYLAVSRGIACSVDQVVVTTGYQGALHLVAHLILAPGDQVWLEDPGYGFTLDLLRALSMRIAPIPVDREGLCVAYGETRYRHARLAVVTPAHQFPLGCTMSLPRRQALLAWARTHASWILEDDYDCEFHYQGYRPTSLKGIDAADRVFYGGSFSKTLFPGLRLGYLVVPKPFIAEAHRACRVLHRGGSVLEQSIVAAFMSEGHFARHLRRMRLRYRLRRQALADALARQFGSGVELCLQSGGLHVLAGFPSHASDVELAKRAREQGLAPHPLSGQSVELHAGQGLLMSFTNIPEDRSAEVVKRLHRAIA